MADEVEEAKKSQFRFFAGALRVRSQMLRNFNLEFHRFDISLVSFEKGQSGGILCGR